MPTRLRWTRKPSGSAAMWISWSPCSPRAASSGRKLDFLMQEMNREANTIGSKGNDVEQARNGGGHQVRAGKDPGADSEHRVIRSTVMKLHEHRLWKYGLCPAAACRGVSGCRAHQAAGTGGAGARHAHRRQLRQKNQGGAGDGHGPCGSCPDWRRRPLPIVPVWSWEQEPEEE